jgi:WD40 repeat protein
MSNIIDAKEVPRANAPSQAAPSAPPPNPFVGPVPLDYGQKLYGRQRETQDLTDLLVSKRIVLLFSPSGAGKTSLIRAGLIPKLKNAYDIEALPIVRLGYVAPEYENEKGSNRYRLATLCKLERLRSPDVRRSAKELSGYTLKRYFDECVLGAIGHNSDGEPYYPLLVFDQFEELLTADALDVDRKREFLDELGSLLRGDASSQRDSESRGSIWALFAIREDRLGELQPFLDLIPTALAFRYRLDALSTEAARETIKETAGDWMEAQVPRAIVEDLCTVSVRGIDGREMLQPGHLVEPVQLQVVCRGLWEKIVARQQRRIEVADIQSREHSEVDRALREFFNAEAESAAKESGVSERKLRLWIEQSLISTSGVRNQILRDQTQLGKIDEAIALLVDAHVLRSDSRDGREWVELPHDRLVGPVRAANTAWILDNQQPFQARAKAWHDAGGGQARRRLLSAEELKIAKAFACTHEDDLTEDERKFIEASEQECARDAQSARLKIAVLSCFVVVLIALISVGFLDWLRKKHVAELSALNQKLSVARDKESTGAALALLLDLEGRATRLNDQGAFEQRVDSAILERLAGSPAAIVRELHPRNHIVWSLAFTEKGDRLLAGSWDGHVSLQDVENPKASEFVTPNLQSNIYAIAFHRGTGMVASTQGDGRMRLWHLDGGALHPVATLNVDAGGRRLTTADFSEDGRWLVAAGWGKSLEVFDLANPGEPVHKVSIDVPGAQIQSINFLPGADDAKRYRLASTDLDGNVRLWLIGEDFAASPKPLREFSISDHQAQPVGISASAVDPTGRWFIAGDTEGSLHAWDLSSADPAAKGVRLTAAMHRGGQQDTQVKGIAFSPQSQEFISVGLDGYLVRWTMPDHAADLKSFNSGLHIQRFKLNERLFSVAYRPNAPGQVAVGGTRSIQLLDLNRGAGPAISAPLPDSTATSWLAVSMNRDGTLIAARANDESVRFWRRDGTRLVSVPEWTVALDLQSAFAVAPTGGSVVIVDCHGEPKEWTLQNGISFAPAKSTDAQASTGCKGVRATSPAISPNGRLLATADANTLHVWARDADGWRPWSSADPLTHPVVDKTMTPPTETITFMVFSADSRWLAVGTDSGSIRVWDIAGGKQLGKPSYVDSQEDVYALAFSPSGTSLRAGGEFGFVTEYAVPGLVGQKPSTRHERSITGIAFSAGDGAKLTDKSRNSSVDDAVLVTTDIGGSVIKWSARGGSWKDPSFVVLATKGGAPVRAMALDKDGVFLVTAGDDLLTWDLRVTNVNAVARTYVDSRGAESARTDSAEPEP